MNDRVEIEPLYGAVIATGSPDERLCVQLDGVGTCAFDVMWGKAKDEAAPW